MCTRTDATSCLAGQILYWSGLALLAFVDAWKNFQWPLIATRSMEMRTVEVGISSFYSFYHSNWPYQMAAAVTAIAPMLLIFFLAQRYFVRGIQLTGLK